MKLLKSSHVRSFVVGASNYLYKRQKGLSDVLVDVSTKELSHISINLLSFYHKHFNMNCLRLSAVYSTMDDYKMVLPVYFNSQKD